MATLKSVGNRKSVDTANRPLKVAIVVATDEIRDRSCEILAKIPQGGVTGTITQCMTGMNA